MAKVAVNFTDVSKTDLQQLALQPFTIPMHLWCVWNNLTNRLPAAAAADDLGLIDNTFGTGSPTIETGDLKAEAGNPTTRYARILWPMPKEYDDRASALLRFHAGMKTTVSDTTATLDVSAYKSDEEGGISSDLVTTAAQSINSLTLADFDFDLTTSDLNAGDLLDIRIAIAINDGATATAVIGQIGAAKLLCDTRG